MEGASPFPRALWWFAAVIFGAAALAAVVMAVMQGPPSLVALAVLGGLAVFGNHRQVALPSGAYLSPTYMVLMASIVVFQNAHMASGAVIVGMACGLFLPDLSRKSWGWIPLNAGTWGLGQVAAALTYAAIGVPRHPTLFIGVLTILPAAIALAAVGMGVLVVSYLVEDAKVPEGFLHQMPRVALEVLPFAILGYLLGRLYVALGPSVMILIVVPIVIAREMFASYMRVKESHDETVQLLVRALEQKDPYTAGHAERVAVYAGYIGEELEFMPARMDRLRFGALMHDIGKLVVPNQLLNKPGKLTEEEFARVRIHEGVSVQMLSHIDFLRPIALHAHSDAMKFDPDDLDHPIEPYIIMVADAYDAMTSTRSYRKALPQEVAFEELRDKSGKQFHPACAEALIRAIEKRNEVHGKGHEEDSHFEDAPEVGLGSAGLGDLLPDEKANQ